MQSHKLILSEFTRTKEAITVLVILEEDGKKDRVLLPHRGGMRSLYS